MSESLVSLLIFPAAVLVALGCLPNSWVCWRVTTFRNVVTMVAGIQFILAGCLAAALVAGWLSLTHAVLIRVSGEFPLVVSIYFDGVSSLMLALVSFIGWVISQYSIRYLDGESSQGSYFRWVSFTLGSVSLMVLSGNLLLFIVAWVMTSLGLHRLLLHYGQRPAARRAAWAKFTISRIGDVALIAAVALIYSQLGTLEFAELFELTGPHMISATEMQIAGFLLVLGAVTKSAQFPFHTWLPQTLETPTPVSALMHAGIVNAGGYLMIRTSPLMAIAPWALTLLAFVGGLTACFAAVVMMTQTSVKKSLAYSTIAQMGFMLLQCGIGAYSAAMLHIIAHSLYKAHAFLSSGSVIAERAAMDGAQLAVQRLSWISLASVGTMVMAFLGIAFAVFGINPVTKPGGLLLGGILCLALTEWIARVMRSGSRALWIRSLVVAAGLCLVYSASFVAVDRLIAPSLPTTSILPLFELVVVIIAAGFLGMLALQAALASGFGQAFLNRWHVHIYNGFYLESALRRLFGPLLHT